MFFSVRLQGTGAVLPADRVAAEDLDQRIGVAPGTSFSRNGVHTRYFANETEPASAMASAALSEALSTASLTPTALDAILFCGVMSEQPMPATAILIHRRLGGRMAGVTCFDINASCGGFLRAIEIAAAGIQSGLWRTVGIAAAELASKGLRWDDLDTCTLFGDGAAAAVLGRSESTEGVIDVRNATISEGADLSVMAAGGSRFNMRTPPPSADDYLFTMNGRGLLRLIQNHLPPMLDELLQHPIDVIIPHQASAVGMAFLRKHLDRRPGPSPVVIDILSETGNQVSVSIPFALNHAIQTRQLLRGQTALLLSTAAGVSISGLVLRY